MSFLILCHIVVTLFTFCTFQCDSCAHNFHLAFFKLNSVLHGSLRDYPNLGIKKRPTSIRQYSVPYQRMGVKSYFFISIFSIYRFIFYFFLFLLIITPTIAPIARTATTTIPTTAPVDMLSPVFAAF